MHYEHALRKMGLCVAVTTQSNNTLRICDARKDQDRLALDCTRKKKQAKKRQKKVIQGGNVTTLHVLADSTFSRWVDVTGGMQWKKKTFMAGRSTNEKRCSSSMCAVNAAIAHTFLRWEYFVG